jgi:hypothetical protein
MDKLHDESGNRRDPELMKKYYDEAKKQKPKVSHPVLVEMAKIMYTRKEKS